MPRETMRTKNGLTVPVGYGGSGKVVLKGAMRPSSSGRAVRSVPPRDRRHVNAEDATVGMRIRGNQGTNVYEVLGTERKGGMIELTVLAPSGTVRTWQRRPTFGLERE